MPVIDPVVARVDAVAEEIAAADIVGAAHRS